MLNITMSKLDIKIETEEDGRNLTVAYNTKHVFKDKSDPRSICRSHLFRIPSSDQKKQTFIFTNTDRFDVWADLGGQDLLFLRDFLDKFSDYLSQVCLIDAQRLAIQAAGINFLSKRPDIRSRLEPGTYAVLLHDYYTKTEQCKSAPGDDNLQYFHLDAAQRWASFCMDDIHSEYDWFKNNNTYREAELGEAIERINLLSKGSKGEDPLAAQQEVQQEAQKAAQQRERACSWFLRWYSLKQAAELSFVGWWRRFLVLWAPEILALIVILYVAVIPLYRESRFRFLYSRNLAWFIYLACPAALVVALIMRHRARVSGGGQQTRRWHVLLPRLAAGITVGYLALLNADVWLGIFDPRLYGPDCRLLSAPVLIRILLPLLAVLGYIYMEIGRRPGIQMNGWKAARIFCRGYAYSILLGLPFSDVFGASLLRDAPASPYALQGAVGFIHPQAILYIAPLAYFIGLFLQLLWEDKSLTEGI